MCDYIQSIIDLIKIDSVCIRRDNDSDYPYGEGVRHALDYVLDLCGKFGFRTRNCNNQIGYAEIGEGDPLTGILVHLDVVPVGEGWTAEQGEIRNGKLFGRGVIDDKGPAVACIYAMKDLLESGRPINGRIRIIFGQAEETGIWTDMEYYLANEEHPAQGFTPDAFFPLIYAEKGLLLLTFRSKAPEYIVSLSGGNAVNIVPDSCTAAIKYPNGGVVEMKSTGKSAHGSMPEEGINAISLMMQTLYSRVKPGEKSIISFYHDCIGMEINGEHLIGVDPDMMSGLATVNPGVIQADEGMVELKVDIRYPVSASYDDIISKVNEAAELYGLDCEIIVHKYPIHLPLDNPFTEGLLDSYRSVIGETPEPISTGGGTYARAMKNIIAFGPLFPGREMTEHEPDEYAYLEDLHLIRKIYAEALAKTTK